jgi:hypothetical protein
VDSHAPVNNNQIQVVIIQIHHDGTSKIADVDPKDWSNPQGRGGHHEMADSRLKQDRDHDEVPAQSTS